MRKLIVYGALSLMLMFPLTVIGQGSEATLYLSKETAEQLLLEDNATLKGLEVAEMELLSNFNDVIAAGDTLESVYDQLPRYEVLTVKYNTTMTNSDYAAYLLLLQKGIGKGHENDLLAYRDDLLLEDTVANSELIIDVEARITYEEAFTESDYLGMISPTEYGEYMMLMNMFTGFGISGTNVSDEVIYDVFINTMEVLPLSLQAGLESLQLNMDLVERSLVSGMTGLYDSINNLDGSKEILYKTYVSAKANAEASDARLILKLETKDQNFQVHIDEEVAKLEYDKLLRQIDTMTLNLKQMIGLDPDTVIVLEDMSDKNLQLDSMNTYLEKALLERSEIITASTAVTNKRSEIKTLEKWFSDSSDRVVEAKEDLEGLERDLIQVTRDIEVDIRKAYNAYLSASLDVESSEADLVISQKLYEGMLLRTEMGTVLTSDLTGMEISVISAQNSLTKAENNYLTAITTLVNASGIGPCYQ